MNSVVFPSGIEITRLGSAARCMQCHQGRESKVSVDGAIEGAGVTDPDTISEDLGFRNIHYYAAAATLYGGSVLGGYQYDGKTYDVKFSHVAGYDTCVDCHNPHSLELKLDDVQHVPRGRRWLEDLKDVRWAASARDYDGDGNVERRHLSRDRGTARDPLSDHPGLRQRCRDGHRLRRHAAIPTGSSTATATARLTTVKPSFANGYKAWTARLLKAAYNYQVSVKDPGAFAHNAKYIIAAPLRLDRGPGRGERRRTAAHRCRPLCRVAGSVPSLG